MFFTIFPLIATIAGISASNNISSLMLAIERGDIVKVKALLNTVDVTSKDELGWNVLHKAVYASGEITRLLISHGADRVVNDDSQYTPPPLLHACTTMHQSEYPGHMYEFMEAILKAGGNPNVSNSYLITPLHAIRTGPEARLLISYGANANAKDERGYTPACFYMQYRRINQEVFYALADGNADFAITNNFGDTIFHMKSDFNQSQWTKEIVAFFARSGVPLNDLNDRGETALTKYLKRNLLLNTYGVVPDRMLNENLEDSFYAHMAEAGANLSAPNQHGQTLLLLAVLNYHAGMAKWLLENGAHVDAKNADGDPPLMALLKQQYSNLGKGYFSFPTKSETAKIKAVIGVLVEGGADVHFKDEGGRDAAYYLRRSRIAWVDWNIEDSLKK